MHSGVMKPQEKPIWYDVYKAFPPKRDPLYVKPISRSSTRKQDTVPEIFYREDEIRAKFYKLYGTSPQAFDLSKSNFVSPCQRFIDKYAELKSNSDLDDGALFEETAKALLQDGITLRRREAPFVSTESRDSLLEVKLTDLLAEQQSMSTDSRETVESNTHPDDNSTHPALHTQCVVPLKSVEVDVEVRDHVASVVSTLNYDNSEDKPVEVAFVFPLPGDAAVCHFSATIGQKQIVAEVKEKQQAREEYDDALSSGQQAFVLEESEESPDIFSLHVGSLPPGETASIRLEYVIELAVQADDGLRFCLPTVLNPRYQPPDESVMLFIDSQGSNVQVSSVPAAQVPYTLSLGVRVSSTHPVSKVESNCSLDPLEYLNAEKTQTTVKLSAGHKFDRDVELLIYYLNAHQPTALVEAGQTSANPLSLMGDPVVMLSLYPDFPQAVLSSLASCREFVFLLDCSGSMSSPLNRSNTNETRIAGARDTLLLLLKSLPMGCYFNIYTFGSSYEHIFPKSVEYTQETMDVALKKVQKIEANLGGTEILKPLKHIFSQTCIPGQPRQLFVFTDGEVSNTKEVISLVKKNSGSHRCFSFGIGEGASSALINGLAREGGGHVQFITGADRMQPKVMQSLKFALQPAVMTVSLVWDLPKEAAVTVLSPPITSIFQGQRSLVYAQLSGLSSTAAEGPVTLNYNLAGELYQNKLHFSLKPAEDNRLTVHRLAARTLIRSLEMESETEHKNVKEEVVKVSVQSGVISTFTVFIGVNKDTGEVIQGPLLLRHIPTGAMMLDSMAVWDNKPLCLGDYPSKPRSAPKIFNWPLRRKQAASHVLHAL